MRPADAQTNDVSDFLRRQLRQQVAKETVFPLQLFLFCGVGLMLVIFLSAIGLAYEADSIEMMEHKLEEDNRTVHHLEAEVYELRESNKLLKNSIKRLETEAIAGNALRDKLEANVTKFIQMYRDYSKHCEETVKEEERSLEEKTKELRHEHTLEQELADKVRKLTGQLRDAEANLKVQVKMNEEFHDDMKSMRKLSEDPGDLHTDAQVKVTEIAKLRKKVSKLNSLVAQYDNKAQLLAAVLCCVCLSSAFFVAACIRHPTVMQSLKTMVEV